jgi:hypothetical protein
MHGGQLNVPTASKGNYAKFRRLTYKLALK